MIIYKNRSKKIFRKRTIVSARTCRFKKSRGSESRKRKHITKAGTGERTKCLIACIAEASRGGGPCHSPLSLSLSFFLLFFLFFAHNDKQQPCAPYNDYATPLGLLSRTDCKLDRIINK